MKKYYLISCRYSLYKILFHYIEYYLRIIVYRITVYYYQDLVACYHFSSLLPRYSSSRNAYGNLQFNKFCIRSANLIRVERDFRLKFKVKFVRDIFLTEFLNRFIYKSYLNKYLKVKFQCVNGIYLAL